MTWVQLKTEDNIWNKNAKRPPNIKANCCTWTFSECWFCGVEDEPMDSLTSIHIIAHPLVWFKYQSLFMDCSSTTFKRSRVQHGMSGPFTTYGRLRHEILSSPTATNWYPATRNNRRFTLIYRWIILKLKDTAKNMAWAKRMRITHGSHSISSFQPLI